VATFGILGHDQVLVRCWRCPYTALEMAHFVDILVVNFKVYSMNKTVKIHQNPTDTSEYDAIKESNSKIDYHHY